MTHYSQKARVQEKKALEQKLSELKKKYEDDFNEI